MKKGEMHCIRFYAIRSKLAILLAAVILMQQIGVQASGWEPGQEDNPGSGQSVSTVSSGDAGAFAGDTGVSSGNADSVSSGDSLSDSEEFVPYEFKEEEYCVEISTERGTCGSIVEAKLKYLGTENREEVSVIWEADKSKFSPAGQTQVSEDFLSAQKYTIITNESSSQKISAQLYHGEHFMGTVESSEFQLKKDSAAPLIKEVYYAIGSQELQELPETGDIWGSGNLTIQVKAEDIAGENDDEDVSGVAAVWVEINGVHHELEQVDDTDTWMAEIAIPKYVYYIFAPSIYAVDYAKNNNLKQLPWFHMDWEKPEVSLSLQNKSGKIDGWYSEALHGAGLQIQIDIKDKSSIEKIEISKTEDFSKILETITNIEKKETGSYKAQSTEGLIQGEQDETYYVRVFDKWGNSTTKSIQIRVDNTAPVDEVGINFCGTEDMLIYLDDTEEGNHEYILSRKQGCIYDKAAINLTLTMEDGTSEDAVSGIEKVTFTLCVRDGNDNNVTQEKIELSSDSFFIREDGKTGASYRLGVPDSDVFEKSFQIQDLYITDKAGNVSPCIVKDQVLYYVDNSVPRVEFTYGTDEIREGKVEDFPDEKERIHYFNQPYTSLLTVRDANLTEAEVSNALIEGNKQAEIKRLAETPDAPVSTREQYQYTLKEDGKYRLSVKADDILHNNKEKDEIIPSLSDSIVVDTAAPQVDIAICSQNGEVISEYANQYFAQDITVQLRIREPYLDMETVAVSITGTDADGEAIAITLDPDSWTEEGLVYTNQYRITEEGYYTISLSCKDKAGNGSEKTTEGFFIDKTAPVVTITYDKNEPLNQFYYNTARTATVTVTDYSFDTAKAQFQVKAVYGSQPVISEWTHHPDAGCDGGRHTKNCTYTATVKFDKDDSYDFTFSCTDQAGLQSESIKEEHFVIDQTAPVIFITFDHYEASHEYFYKRERTAYIQIEDISFDADLVKVAKSEEQTVDNLPALSGFTGGGKMHTGSLYFDEDGTYQFTVEATDLAGNKAEIKTCPLFILDMTAPELVISGVGAFSANKGKVMPKIEYRDKYLYDTDSVLEIDGYYHGTITGAFTKEAITDGFAVSYEDFPYTQDTDDLYTLHVVIKDYAGNETQDTLVFSVNRFGSVYVLSEESRAALDDYYHAKAPEIVITEINVDTLEKRQVTSSRDGITLALTEEKDYTVHKQGTEVTWKSYSYILPADNFEEEGHYVITVSSTDKAKNSSDNRSKGTEITFAVDKTAPSIVVSGIEPHSMYNREELTVRADIKDNMSMECVAVYDGDKVLQEYDADTLAQNHGEITFKLAEDTGKRDIRITAQDTAGNINEQIFEEVAVTTELNQITNTMAPLASAISNEENALKPMRLLWFVILAGSVLFVGTGVVFLMKRRKSR